MAVAPIRLPFMIDEWCNALALITPYKFYKFTLPKFDLELVLKLLSCLTRLPCRPRP